LTKELIGNEILYVFTAPLFLPDADTRQVLKAMAYQRLDKTGIFCPGEINDYHENTSYDGNGNQLPGWSPRNNSYSK